MRPRLRQAAASVADANVRVARANVANLAELVRFGAVSAVLRDGDAEWVVPCALLLDSAVRLERRKD